MPKSHLSREAAIEEPPTTDLVAYDLYLRAKDLINGIAFSTRAKEDLLRRGATA